MRVRVRFALLVLALACAAPANDNEPTTLLRPIVPDDGAVRVRFTVSAGTPRPMYFHARVPSANKGEVFNVTAALSTHPGSAPQVSAKRLEKWGYTPGKGKEFVLPELLISASQVAPRPRKGSDATLRLTNVAFTVVETPNSEDGAISRADMSVPLSALCAGGERAAAPRLAFADRFLELTAPAADVERPGTSLRTVPKVTASSDTVLVAAAWTPAYLAVNGRQWYRTAEGAEVRVTAFVSAGVNWQAGVIMSVATARACAVEMDETAEPKVGTGLTGKSAMIPGKVRELRLSALAGPRLAVERDIVLKDVPVMVNKDSTTARVAFGPKFLVSYFRDAVYTNTGDGWTLHARIDPDLLSDVSARPKQ